MFTRIFTALGVAVLLMYLILVVQFGSFLDPLAILVSLPLSLIGVVLALLVTGDTLNIMSLIGVILLMGIVAKNAILLIDFAKWARERGLPLREALIEAGRIRLRPIIMTTLALIAGMIPVAHRARRRRRLPRPAGPGRHRRHHHLDAADAARHPDRVRDPGRLPGMGAGQVRPASGAPTSGGGAGASGMSSCGGTDGAAHRPTAPPLFRLASHPIRVPSSTSPLFVSPSAMPFETTVVRAAPAGYETPFLAVALVRGGLPASLAALDTAAGGALGRLFAAGDFTGKRDETALLYPPGAAGRILLIGMGKADEISRGSLRRAAGTAARRMRAVGVARGAFHLPQEARGSVGAEEAGQAIAEGLEQGAWQFNEMKRPPEEKKPALERIDILPADDADALERGHRVGAALGAGQTLRARHPGPPGQRVHADLPRRTWPRPWARGMG